MFPIYPYINVNDLNLDYLLKSIKEIQTQVEYFVSLNAIKYADPIQWDITRQYEKNTIVIDPQTGTAYISVAPVPIGAQLTRPEYWTVVFDLGSFVVRASKNFAINYESDTTTTATFNTPAGGWLVWGDVLYIANVPITAGDSYVDGGNISHFTMEEIIGHLSNLLTTDKDSVVDAINELYTALNNAVNTLSLIIGDLNDLTTSDKTSVVNAINSLQTDITNLINSTIGDLNDLTTTDKTSVVNAINELVSDLGTLSNVIGDLNDLITTDNTSIVNAINEVKGDFNAEDLKVGDLNDLNTGDKSSIVNAINDISSIIPTGMYVTPEDFGAVGDGVTDDYQAISDAFDEAQSTGKTLYFDHKTYACSQTINRTGTLNHNIIMDGVILMTSNVDGLIFDKVYSKQLKLSILSATQNANSGITFNEIDSSNIEIVKIGLFDYGLNLKATGGISYNTFNIGMIFNAEYCLYFNAQSGGWVNENLFLNGRFWKNSAFTGTCRGIYMTNVWYNNNVFIKPSVEGCNLGIKMENGSQNHFYEIRSEGMNGDTINLDSPCAANYFKIGYNDSTCTVTDNGQYLNNTITYASVMQPNFFNIANGPSFRKCYANTNLSLPEGMFVMSNNTEGNTYVYGGVRNTERINYSYPVFSKYNVKSIAGKIITILINTVNKEDITAHFQFRDSSNNIISTVPRCNTTVTYRDDGYGNNIIGTYTEPYNRALKIQIPSNAVVMYVNLKSASGYSGYSIFTDVDIPITPIINKVSGLTAAPTDTTNCDIGDYCNNVDTNTPTLKGWFFDGSTWSPDYINSTP